MRETQEIIEQIHELLESRVAPAVASHGGIVNYVDYADGVLKLQMSGSCAGCASSTMTLKYGIEGMMKHYVPEIHTIESEDDEITNPFYTEDPMDVIPTHEVLDDTNS